MDKFYTRRIKDMPFNAIKIGYRAFSKGPANAQIRWSCDFRKQKFTKGQMSFARDL